MIKVYATEPRVTVDAGQSRISAQVTEPRLDAPRNMVINLGSAGVVAIRNVPATVHTVAHNIGRLPTVDVTTLGGVEIEAAITRDAMTVTVELAQPLACIIICT
jgi:hypothetical protein